MSDREKHSADPSRMPDTVEPRASQASEQEANEMGVPGSIMASIAGAGDTGVVALRRFGRAQQHQALLGMQRSVGNGAVLRMLGQQQPVSLSRGLLETVDIDDPASVRRHAGEGRLAQQTGRLTPSASIQRQGMVLGGLSLAQNQIGGVQGGLDFSSQQVTYPKDLDRVGWTKHKSVLAADFYSSGLLSNNNTQFRLYGEFSDSDDPANGTNRVMANVHIDLADTTTYASHGSSLSFHAMALATPAGSAEDPRLRFVCRGRFNPAGSGDCSYRVELDVDQHANIRVFSADITSGHGNLTRSNSGYGFGLTIGSDPGLIRPYNMWPFD